MAYKDKDKQKEANKQASRRYRAKAKGMTQASDTVIPAVIPLVIPFDVIPVDAQPEIPVSIPRQPLTKEQQVSRKGFNVSNL